MESEAKIQQYLLLGKGAKGRAAVDLIQKATSEPGLYAFGEVLDLESIKQLQDTELAPSYQLLRIFAYGTLADYKAQAATMGPINQQQTQKLKQLTVMSLAKKSKVLQYTELMSQLDIPTVRELEDFLITECFYNNILKGKLDQKQRALQVHDVAPRDVLPEELPAIAARLEAWLATSSELLSQIEGRITYAQQAAEAAEKQKSDLEAKAEEMRRNLKTEAELHQQDQMMADADQPFEMMQEDRTSGRPKRRR